MSLSTAGSGVRRLVLLSPRHAGHRAAAAGGRRRRPRACFSSSSSSSSAASTAAAVSRPFRLWDDGEWIGSYATRAHPQQGQAAAWTGKEKAGLVLFGSLVRVPTHTCYRRPTDRPSARSPHQTHTSSVCCPFRRSGGRHDRPGRLAVPALLLEARADRSARPDARAGAGPPPHVRACACVCTCMHACMYGFASISSTY